MSASTRFRAELQRADTELVTPLAELDLHEEHGTVLALDPLTIAASGSFTVAGLTSITEVMLLTDGQPALLELTKAGPLSFQLPVNEVVYLGRADLVGLRVLNPSSTQPLIVKLIVGGES